MQSKRIYSELLDRMIPMKVTTHALRLMDKAGGERLHACRPSVPAHRAVPRLEPPVGA